MLVGSCQKCGSPASLRCVSCGRTFCRNCLDEDERICSECQKLRKGPTRGDGRLLPPSRHATGRR